MERISQPSGPSPAQLTTFSRFSELPTELRLKIWHHCIPGPRDLHIKSRNHRGILGRFSFRGWFVDSASLIDGGDDTSAIPTILHVNSEAREVGLTRYELAFGSYRRAGTAYVDFERDNLNLTQAGSNCLFMLVGGRLEGINDVEKVRNLECRAQLHFWDSSDFCWEDVMQFTGLRKLSFRVDEDFIGEYEIPGLNLRLDDFARRHTEWILPDIRMCFEQPGVEKWVTLKP
ncbi:hypothetical protein BELL_0581g00010 [Botrytis elliptica]|uniref:2EXR domain-containing protein n=1 Tax=Botrytis elliptica TaxID=278938 RepID=A0A4Z1JR70_9HELO|nr:hypothetical protein EAE99_008138 [Botrytis elliptica]TGO71397.1 hypothetical protein BELL_0581g00010 [Botrytis elliptica]